MRPLPAVLLTLAMSSLASGQTYAISTFAGGGLPVGIPGTSASLSVAALQFIATDQSGNVFFVDQNTVLRLDATTGILTLVAGNGTTGFSGDRGPAASAQLYYPQGLAVDSAGNLYISDTQNNRIRKVSNGVIATVAGNGTPGFSGDNGPAASAQLNQPSGLAVDSAGNLYIADSGNNLIRKVSNGVIATVAGGGSAASLGDNGPATSAPLADPIGIAVDSAGNLYIADLNDNRVREVSSGVITTVAGNGDYGFSGDNGPATSAQLNGPQSVAVDSAGNLYIADSFNNRIRKVANGVITTVAGNGLAGFSGDNGPAASAQLNFPASVAVDSAGNLYIGDAFNYRIRKISNGAIATVAGNGNSSDNGPAASAQPNFSGSVAVDSAGNLYTTADGYVLKVSGGVIATVAGNGTNGFSGDNGPATSAQLDGPAGIAVDSAGDLYIADYRNSRIRKVSNGVITTVAGNGTSGFNGDSGPATSIELRPPTGVAVDSAGNLYIADTYNNRIRKVSNGVMTTVVGSGPEEFGGDNGPAASAWLDLPTYVIVDSAGNLYIADTGNLRIRKVSNGVITTVAGNGLQGSSGDNGLATDAEFNRPEGIAVDSAGNIYIADSGANRVRKVSGGVIATVAGNGTPGFSGDNGPATSAQLNLPAGVAVGSAGNVYIGDSGNGRVRLLTPSASSCNYSVSPTTLQAPASGGSLTVSIQTTASCSWAVSGLPTWITVYSNFPATGSAGITLAFAPNPGTPLTATILVAGVSVVIVQPAGPAIDAGGIVNAASYAAGMPLAPGSIATAYGSFLLAAPASAAGLPLPTSLAGLSMQFGMQFGIAMQAPLFFADLGQVNFQVPWELARNPQASFAAVLNGQSGASQTLNLAPFSPGIFSTNAQGTGQGAILNSSYALVNSSNPATAGSTIVQIYCTGLGAVTNQPPTGSPASGIPLSMTTTAPTVTIGGSPATVMFSGLAPGLVGGYQINALVPAASSKGAAVPVVISIGGVTSNTVTIAVQ